MQVILKLFELFSGTCSDTFKRHNKSQLTGICGWSGGEFDTLVDRSLQWQVSASVDEPKSTRSTPSRRNRSAKTYNDTVRSNYRTHKSGSLSDVSTTHRMKHQQPKRSASTHACTGSRLPSSSPSSTLSKQQFLHQSVKNIQFEFAHFEDWKDHIEHYRNTVTNKVQSKYVEHNAPGFTVSTLIRYLYFNHYGPGATAGFLARKFRRLREKAA